MTEPEAVLGSLIISLLACTLNTLCSINKSSIYQILLNKHMVTNSARCVVLVSCSQQLWLVQLMWRSIAISLAIPKSPFHAGDFLKELMQQAMSIGDLLLAYV